MNNNSNPITTYSSIPYRVIILGSFTHLSSSLKEHQHKPISGGHRFADITGTLSKCLLVFTTFNQTL